LGGWKRRVDGDLITVEASVLTRLSAAERKLLIEAARSFQEFAIRDVRVTGLSSRRRAKSA
jgi:hypothetical protein